MHGSDTGSYEKDGEFETHRFDEIFEKWSSAPYKDGLSIWDTIHMWRSQWDLFDIFGPIANAVEWFAVWYTLAPKDGWIRKEDLRGVYDGSIYYKLAAERSGTANAADATANGKMNGKAV